MALQQTCLPAVLLLASVTSAQQGAAGPVSSGPVGGPAPANAVELATLNFIKLYNEAAALAAAAPDIDGTPDSGSSSPSASQPSRSPSLAYPPPSYFAGMPFFSTEQYLKFYQSQQQQQQQQPQSQKQQQQQQQQQQKQQQQQQPQQQQQQQQKQQQQQQPQQPPRRFPQSAIPSPESNPLAAQLPQPVTETPEVAAARAAFFKQYEYLANLSRNAPDPEPTTAH